MSSSKRSFTSATNQFATLTLEKYKYTEKFPFVFSAYSIMSVLTMLYVGTTGESRKNMNRKLKLPIRDAMLEQLEKLLKQLNVIEHCNMVLIKDSMIKDLNSDYSDKISRIGTIETFSTKNPSLVAKRVNDIVDKTTHSLIKEILTTDMIDGNTVCILLNCIYFKLKWDIPFDKKKTEVKPFYSEKPTPSSEKIEDVEMMQMFDKKFKYTENDSYQLLEMDYEGKDFTFGVLLPTTSTFSIPKLEEMELLISKLVIRKINHLMIPKFKQESSYDVETLLGLFGLNMHSVEVDDMFNDINEPLKVDKIIHKAVIIVDEAGTEAAAATVMVMKSLSMMRKEETINFIADHPFVYYIRHIDSNTFIFNGLYQ